MGQIFLALSHDYSHIVVVLVHGEFKHFSTTSAAIRQKNVYGADYLVATPRKSGTQAESI
jgi:hypothetical protein